MDEKVRKIGSPEGLLFELALTEDEQHERGLAWGSARLLLGGEAVWTDDDTTSELNPIMWTWVDLLEFLARIWPWLLLEESYPIPVSPLHPGYLQREAERRWEDMPDPDIEREEESVQRFLMRHDLAAGLKGLFLPSVILMRAGKYFLCHSSAGGQTLTRPRTEVVDTLGAVGDHIAGFVRGSGHPRGEAAVAEWDRRSERLVDTAVSIRSGLTDESRRVLQQSERDEEFWEFRPDEPERDTEIFAAARMTAGVVSHVRQRELLDLIRGMPRRPTPDLDADSRDLCRELPADAKAHDQGYFAAAWLRERLGYDANVPVDPQLVIERYDVGIGRIELTGCAIEAIAAWGPNHGPEVVLNSWAEARPAHAHGARTTLAHELCHLLLDRNGMLPVGETLGGNTLEFPEKRARAFAAEFLLPRETAAARVRKASTVVTAIREMVHDFNVSEELVAWQVRNSSARQTLGEEDLSEVESRTRARVSSDT